MVTFYALLFFQRRACGLTLSFIFHSQRTFFLFDPLLGPGVCFLSFGLIERGPVTIFLPHVLTHLLGPFSSLGLRVRICRNVYNTLLSCMGKMVSHYIIYQRYSLVLREIIIYTERTVNVVFPY